MNLKVLFACGFLFVGAAMGSFMTCWVSGECGFWVHGGPTDEQRRIRERFLGVGAARPIPRGQEMRPRW